MNIKERKEKQAEDRKAAITTALGFISMPYLIYFHQMRHVTGKAYRCSYTKKGPGRVSY